jgi:hypothetical protein
MVAQPGPSPIGQCLNSGLGWLEVEPRPCKQYLAYRLYLWQLFPAHTLAGGLMLKTTIYFRSTTSIFFVGLVGLAIALVPSRSLARNNGALVGTIVGIAAAAMIANGIAHAHRVRPVRVARHRKRAPATQPNQTTQTGSDPFAGVAASKVRPVSGN